jgi:hypothetical protein
MALRVDMKKQIKSTSGPAHAASPVSKPPRRADFKNKEKKSGRTRGRPGDSVKRIETDPALNNEDSTAGTGMLPPIGDDDPNAAPSG